MKNIIDFMGLFVEQLKEQKDGERQQLEALKKLREQTTSNALQGAIDVHIGKTREQMERLEDVFSLLERNIHGENNMGVKGLIDEAFELEMRCTDDDVRDAGIIASIQHLNHHNIASYGTLCTYAEELAEKNVAILLRESLAEEKNTDRMLSGLAKEEINLRAIH
ncbi:YciE/YciF ferroxidase family protein [Ekhidna sp.]